MQKPAMSRVDESETSPKMGGTQMPPKEVTVFLGSLVDRLPYQQKRTTRNKPTYVVAPGFLLEHSCWETLFCKKMDKNHRAGWDKVNSHSVSISHHTLPYNPSTLHNKIKQTSKQIHPHAMSSRPRLLRPDFQASTSPRTGSARVGVSGWPQKR